MDPARRRNLERWAPSSRGLDEWGVGSGVAGWQAQLGASGLGSGDNYRGITIMPRHLGDPSDSPGLRFQDAQDARNRAQKILDGVLDLYGDVGEVYTAGQKVLDGISAKGLVPLRVQRKGTSLAFDLDFLNDQGLQRTILGLITVQGGPKSWKLRGQLKLVPLPEDVPNL